MTTLYFTKSPDFAPACRAAGMAEVGWMTQACFTKYLPTADASKPSPYALDAGMVYDELGRWRTANKEPSLIIVNAEWSQQQTDAWGDGRFYTDPRDSPRDKMLQAVVFGQEAMEACERMYTGAGRCITLTCNLPMRNVPGTGGVLGWARSIERLSEWGVFSNQSHHFFDVWMRDVRRGQWKWILDTIDTSAALRRFLPPLPTICQVAPTDRDGRPLPSEALAAQIERCERHGLIPLVWIGEVVDGGAELVTQAVANAVSVGGGVA